MHCFTGFDIAKILILVFEESTKTAVQATAGVNEPQVQGYRCEFRSLRSAEAALDDESCRRCDVREREDLSLNALNQRPAAVMLTISGTKRSTATHQVDEEDGDCSVEF